MSDEYFFDIFFRKHKKQPVFIYWTQSLLFPQWGQAHVQSSSFLFFLHCVCAIWNSLRPVCAAWVIQHMWTITNFIWEELLCECSRQRGGRSGVAAISVRCWVPTFFFFHLLLLWHKSIWCHTSDSEHHVNQRMIFVSIKIAFIYLFVCFCHCGLNLNNISFTAPDRYRYCGAAAAAHYPKDGACRRLFLFNLTRQTVPGLCIWRPLQCTVPGCPGVSLPGGLIWSAVL